MFQLIINEEKCIGIGECVDICIHEVIQIVDEKAVPVEKDECDGCENCVEVCEQQAITLEEL